MSEPRRAVVTGAARGIGRGIAEELAAAGARVVVADVDEAAARETAAALGPDAVPLAVDVTDEASVASLAAAAREALGGVDLLVNNAGVLSALPVLEMPVTEWDRVMAVNARGVFLCSKAFAPLLIETRGAIVNVASIGGKRGDALLAHYCASKFAVVGFTQALAAELAPHGVRVNAVCPGTVDTAMMEELAARWGTSLEGVVQRGQLLKRPQTPREIGAAVLFLARAEAITGQAINVDGGTLFH